MTFHSSDIENKSCRWLNHCCWHKGLLVIIILALMGGLYWRQKYVDHEVHILRDKLQRGTPAQLRTQVDTINLLVNMANAELVTFGDKAKALQYLSKAQQQTQALSHDEMRSHLRKALSEDTQALNGVETISMTALSETINTLIHKADQLIVGKIATDVIPVKPAASTEHAAQPSQTPAEKPEVIPAADAAKLVQATPEAVPENPKSWHDKLQAGWDQLKDLVRIESKGASDNVIEAWLVPAKLTLQLEEIKLAGFYRDDAFFHQLIAQTIEWISTHYDVDKDEKVRYLQTELAKMKNWNLTPNPNALQQTMTALENVNKIMSIGN